jgi:RNA 2',3'-cyclic 3'-phosphodiesterase
MTSEQLTGSSRVFTAVSLSEEARSHVTGIMDEAAARVSGVRWVPAVNLHVTLRFIGQCLPAGVAEMVEWMQKAARHLPAEIEVGGLGGFPSAASARVIWVGAREETGTLDRVYNVLDKGADKCGFAREGRKYRPHITVGRARKKPAALPVDLLETIFASGTITMDADEIVLYESILNTTGAEYRVIQRVRAGSQPARSKG